MLAGGQLANNPSVPEEIRDVCSWYHRSEERKISSAGGYARLRQLQADVKFNECHTRLTKLAECRDPNLRAFLEINGCRTSQGKGLKSLVIKYLKDNLFLDDAAEKRIGGLVQQTTGIVRLVELFGSGILVFFSASAGSQ